MLKAKPAGILRPLPPLHRLYTGRTDRRRSALGASLLVALLAAAGLLLWPAGPAQAQSGPPAPENLSCNANTEQVVFLWAAAE